MIYSYHRPSGASKLARALRLSISFRDGSTIRRRLNPLPHINWGWRAQEPGVVDNYLNADPRIAVSKVLTFEKLAAVGIPIPRWSKTLDELKAQLPSGRTIIARRDGLSGGKGMSLVVPATPAYEAPADFYVERLSCRREFRIHIFQGSVIHRQAKFVPHGFDGIARNWENGCYFTSEQLERFATEAELRDLEQLSIRSIEALGLDFGAVDILITRRGNKPYVLEVNTAPGLRSGATYVAYEGALRRLYGIS